MGQTIGPGAFLVLARNRNAFANAYGRGIPVADVFPGFPGGSGTTLRLVKPGDNPGDDRVVNAVTFRNSDKPTTVVLDLVKLKEGWRIADITWQRDGETTTLRGLFTPQ